MKQHLLISLIVFLFGCSTSKQTPAPKDSRCYQVPDAGMCRAVKPRYYYDKVDGKCKEFIWGGCGGVVPFNTLEECVKGCGCDTIRPLE